MRESSRGSNQKRARLSEQGLPGEAQGGLVADFTQRIKDALKFEHDKYIGNPVGEVNYNGTRYGKIPGSTEYYFEELILDDGYPHWNRFETQQGQMSHTTRRTDSNLSVVASGVTNADILSITGKLDYIRKVFTTRGRP